VWALTVAVAVLALSPAEALLHISAIILIGAFLFAAVEWIEPNGRLAIILKCAILATGGAAIATQLLP
jgi:hypothetical protein